MAIYKALMKMNETCERHMGPRALGREHQNLTCCMMRITGELLELQTENKISKGIQKELVIES